MNDRAVAGVVLALYTAAGRRPGDAEYETWARLLADLHDEEVAEEAAVLLARQITDRLPGPRQFRETYQAVLRRKQDARSLPEAPRPDPTPEERERVLAGMADLRRRLRGTT